MLKKGSKKPRLVPLLTFMNGWHGMVRGAPIGSFNVKRGLARTYGTPYGRRGGQLATPYAYECESAYRLRLVFPKGASITISHNGVSIPVTVRGHRVPKGYDFCVTDAVADALGIEESDYVVVKAT